jgi:hypothetical protein
MKPENWNSANVLELLVDEDPFDILGNYETILTSELKNKLHIKTRCDLDDTNQERFDNKECLKYEISEIREQIKKNKVYLNDSYTNYN